MKNSKPINTLTAHILERLVTDHAPIHYRKAIRAAKPYISFIYIDTDTFPTVTNIPQFDHLYVPVSLMTLLGNLNYMFSTEMLQGEIMMVRHQ